MNFSLTLQQQRLYDSVLHFARSVLSKGAERRDRAGAFPADLWKRCASQGLHGLPVPRRWGGLGLDAESSCVALEALGRGCEDGGFAFALGAQLLSCTVPILQFGSPKQRQELKALCGGRRIAANAMTEPASGSDVYSMATRAEREAGGFRLHGRKTFVSCGPVADFFIIYAVTDASQRAFGGITAFLVERAAAGLRVTPRIEKMGLRSCPMAELELRNVRVGLGSVLGGVGGGTAVFSAGMAWERVGLAAVQVGAMRRLLERALTHARSRRMHGQPIGKFQAVSHRLADIKTHLEAARLLVYRAAASLDRGEDATLDAAITKLFVSEALVKTALGAFQTLGAYGYLRKEGMERDVRDALAATIYSGTSDIQKNIIARLIGL